MSKRKVLFAVGSATGPQSPVYSLFFDTRRPDLYISGRAISHEIKASLHASGRWRIAFVSGSPAANLRDPAADRAVLKWQRPAAFEPGLTRGLQIVVPRSVVTNWNARLDEPGRVLWVGIPPMGSATYFDVILSAPGWPREACHGEEWPGKQEAGSTLRFSHLLCTGETVWVVSWERRFNEAAWIARFQIEPHAIHTRNTYFAVHKTLGYGACVEAPIPTEKPD